MFVPHMRTGWIVLLTCLALGPAACAALGPKTEGVADSIAWRATDLRLGKRIVYQPGVTSWPQTDHGTWTLPAGGSLRMPFGSSILCNPSGACDTPKPLWRITVTGTDDQAKPVRAVIDISLPPL